MPEKDPTSYELLTYLWVIGLAMTGGAVGFYEKWKRRHSRVFSVIEFAGEIVTAGFIGVITFWLCEAANISQLITAASVGVSGHMGSRSLFALKKRLGMELEK